MSDTALEENPLRRRLELTHPHLRLVNDRLTKLFQEIRRPLCSVQLRGAAISTLVNQEPAGIQSQTTSLYLTNDGKSGICPVWFTIYLYDKVDRVYAATPGNLVAVKDKSMEALLRDVDPFIKQHAKSRYRDVRHKASNQANVAYALIRRELRALGDVCMGEVLPTNPDTGLVDPTICHIDLFLKDQQADEGNLYTYKVRLVIASPIFIAHVFEHNRNF